MLLSKYPYDADPKTIRTGVIYTGVGQKKIEVELVSELLSIMQKEGWQLVSSQITDQRTMTLAYRRPAKNR